MSQNTTPVKDTTTIAPSPAATAAAVAAKTIEDYDLPKSIIFKVAKSVMPDGYQIQKDARIAFARSCTVFINYLTAAAHDASRKSGRRAINCNDVYKALQMLELDEILLEKVQEATKMFQNQAKEKRDELKKRKESAAAATVTTESSMEVDAGLRPSSAFDKFVTNAE